MIGTCLLVGGAFQAMLAGPGFTVSWRHSVEKTRWEERYVLAVDALVLAESRIEGLGAGMEAPPGARLVDGMWSWVPPVPPLPEMRLTLSPFAGDYTICWVDGCALLRELVHAQEVDVVTLMPCAR